VRPIAIYGATGTIGALVAAALHARGHALRLVGRDEARLARAAGPLGAAHRVAAAHDAGALADALAGAALVVSCAGPFATVGEPVLAAAIAAGAHYLDTTGEQAFARRAYERFDARARRAGVVAVPATAFEAALADWGAALAAAALPGDDPLDELAIAYALEPLPLVGATRASLLAGLTEPGVVWDVDRWIESAPAARGRAFGFPAPFGARDARSVPAASIVTAPRHVASRRIDAFASFGDGPAIRAGVALAALAAPLLPILLESPLGGLLRAAVASAPVTALPGARAPSRFAIVVEAVRRFRRATLTIAGADPYAATAAIVAEAADALVAEAPPRAGVLAPAEAFAAARFLPRVAVAAGLALDGDAAPAAR
jgi:short subunit dehydrogenase-like uncharacterized protein